MDNSSSRLLNWVYRVYHKDPITVFLVLYSPWWCHSQSPSWFYLQTIHTFKWDIICSNMIFKRCSKESKQKINLLSECILSQLTVNETWFSCDFWTCNCQRTSSYQNSNILVATMVCFESCKSKYHRNLQFLPAVAYARALWWPVLIFDYFD